MNSIKAGPTVSIGMPVFNGGSYISEAIETLLSQTYSDFELIISDNGSIDGTASICREYAARDSRIKYVRQEKNRGIFANYRFVLDEAQGRYFMWAACDDRWRPRFVEVCVDVLDKNADCVSVFSNYQVIDLASGRTIVINSPTPSASSHLFDRVFLRIFEMSPTMFYGLHRTPQLKSIGVEDFDLYDVYVTIALSQMGKMLVVPSALFIAGSKNMGTPYSLTGQRISLRRFRKRVVQSIWRGFSGSDRLILVSYFVFVVMRAQIAFFRQGH